MDYKKILGDILIVTAGVAVYMLVAKPLVDKASIGKQLKQLKKTNFLIFKFK